MLRLTNKVSIITGAGAGIGEASVKLFGQEGAKIFAVDKNEEALKKVIAEGKKNGIEIDGTVADVSKASDCEHMVSSAEKAFGAVHVLFNNAGIMHGLDDDSVNTSEDVWDLTMDINVKGVFLGCKYGIPALRRAGGGAVVNTASFVSFLGAATTQLAYTSSKGAVLAMSRELGVIHARENIRVNALCPGPLRTELLMAFLDTEKKKQRRLVHVPMGRFGLAEEMAKAALFLASDDSSYMTAGHLLVDGGISGAYVTPE